MRSIARGLCWDTIEWVTWPLWEDVWWEESGGENEDEKEEDDEEAEEEEDEEEEGRLLRAG
jgi:hypothetical protein